MGPSLARGGDLDNIAVRILDNVSAGEYSESGMSRVRSRNNNAPVYVISIAADLLGLHPRTLRIYEEKGLVQPARRHQQRLYSDRDLERVRMIRHLTQEVGLNLVGVRLVLEMYERVEYQGSKDAVSWVFERTMRRRRAP